MLWEAKLSERGLYNDISAYKTQNFDASITSRDYINFLSFCDGKHDLVDISSSINLEISKVLSIYKTLYSEKIITNK